MRKLLFAGRAANLIASQRLKRSEIAEPKGVGIPLSIDIQTREAFLKRLEISPLSTQLSVTLRCCGVQAGDLFLGAFELIRRLVGRGVRCGNIDGKLGYGCCDGSYRVTERKELIAMKDMNDWLTCGGPFDRGGSRKTFDPGAKIVEPRKC